MSGTNDTVVDYDDLGAALSGEGREGDSAKDTGNDQLSALEARISEKDTMIGRQSNEIGELRGQLAALSAQVNAVQQPRADEPGLNIQPEDLVERPAETIQKILELHDKNRAAADSERLDRIEAAISTNALSARHSDYVEVSNSPEFLNWAAGSPLRATAFNRARAGDTESAISLLDEFKSAQADSVDLGTVTERAHEAARDAGLVRGNDEAPSGQLFKRSAIMKMRAENPDEYERLQPQILKAYAEKRVID